MFFRGVVISGPILTLTYILPLPRCAPSARLVRGDSIRLPDFRRVRSFCPKGRPHRIFRLFWCGSFPALRAFGKGRRAGRNRHPTKTAPRQWHARRPSGMFLRSPDVLSGRGYLRAGWEITTPLVRTEMMKQNATFAAAITLLRKPGGEQRPPAYHNSALCDLGWLPLISLIS